MERFGQQSQVPTLKPGELFERRRQRDGAKLKSYNKLLEQIYIRIRASSRDGGDPWITYVVPPFILGLPKIDLEDCIVYLVYMLRVQGYEVRYTYPNLLYISWKHHEKDYILKGSPIMSAMLASQSSKPKAELRGQRGGHVRFAESITTDPFGPPGSSGSTAAASFGSEPRIRPPPGGRMQPVGSRAPVGRAPPRNVQEYQPPTSFLDAVEQPVAEPRRGALEDFLHF
jgi:hypothetical protein